MSAWLVLTPILVVGFLLILCFALYFSTPSKRNYDLKGKHAVVTGGSKGIGREIATSLIKRGANVSIFARNEADLKKACEQLQKYANELGNEQQVRWYSVDMTSAYSQIEENMHVAETELGPVDVLINNAGNSVQAAFEKLPSLISRNR